MRRASRYSPEVRERAVRLVLEHEDQCTSQWAGIESVAGKIGCAPETLPENDLADEETLHRHAC